MDTCSYIHVYKPHVVTIALSWYIHIIIILKLWLIIAVTLQILPNGGDMEELDFQEPIQVL